MATRWEEMTVSDLRKYAREHRIPLSAGINKQGIIERLTEYEQGQQSLLDAAEPAPAAQPGAEQEATAEAPKRPVRKASIIADDDDESREIGYGMGTYSRPAADRPRYSSDPVRPAAAAPSQHTSDVLSTISSKAPAFHIDNATKAWHNPRSFQQGNYHAPQQSAQGTHAGYQQRTADTSRAPAQGRAPAAAPQPPQRFGPAETPRQPEQPPVRGDMIPDGAAAQEAQPRGVGYQYARTTVQPPALRDYQSLGKPAVNELLAQDESVDAEGLCVLLKDGSAFLYADDSLDDETIICLTAAQVRRFQLRTGDLVGGKIRMKREGDKYRFMLYVTGINGIPLDDVKNRASVDSLRVMLPAKKLTALPVRTEEGEKATPPSAPVQFGQRVFAAVNDSTLKAAFELGKQIQDGKPNARLMLVSVQDVPEEAALVKAALRWPLYAVDQVWPVDKQCQALELAAARAARLAEQKEDVVILISCPVPPAELEEPVRDAVLRLFAAGRAFKEGGSMTVILTAPQAPDTAFGRVAGLSFVLRQDGEGGMVIADGSVQQRAFQIFV